MLSLGSGRIERAVGAGLAALSLLALDLVGPLLGGDQACEERFFLGRLGARRVLAITERTRALEGGAWETVLEEEAALGGPGRSLERRRQVFVERGDGVLVRASIQGEGAAPDALDLEGRLSARGSPGPVLGPRGEAERIRAALASGERTLRLRTPAVLEGEWREVEKTLDLLGLDAGGASRWRESSPLTRRALETVRDAAGRLTGARYELAGESFVLEAVESPAALDGPPLVRPARVRGSGRVSAAEVGRYRVPESLAGLILEDAFQKRDGGVVTVWDQSPPAALDAPEHFLQPEPGIEAGDAALLEWVRRALADASAAPLGAGARIRALRDAVRRQVSVCAPVAGGTALSALGSRRGDCTELARFLCAALRSAGIPARLEYGLMAEAGGAWWTAHAWVSAYAPDEGRWVHADAAMPGARRSGYLKLADASGRGGREALERMAELIERRREEESIQLLSDAGERAGVHKEH